METKYLPLWANTYSDFKSQYDACSIMIKSDNANTLLPVRLDEDVCPYLSLRLVFGFTVNKFYGESGFWRHKNYIQNAKFAFAKKLYNVKTVFRKSRFAFFGYSSVYNSKKTSAFISGSLFVIKRAQPYRSEGNESKPKRSGLFR